jgi:hypothetical protein
MLSISNAFTEDFGNWERLPHTTEFLVLRGLGMNGVEFRTSTI